MNSYIVSWQNQDGPQEYRRFSLDQATRVAATIYSRPDAYGAVTSVSIILSDEPLDERSVDREGQTPCLSALASAEACQPDETLKRCAICGFVVDTKIAAEKPTVRMRP